MFLTVSPAKDFYWLPLNVEVANAVQKYPASTAFIDISNFSKIGFILAAGALNSALTCQVMQDKSATQTAAIKNVDNAVRVVGATDDNKLCIVEVDTDQLDKTGGFKYVTLDCSGAAGGDDYLGIIFYGIPNSKPATQPATVIAPVILAG